MLRTCGRGPLVSSTGRSTGHSFSALSPTLAHTICSVTSFLPVKPHLPLNLNPPPPSCPMANWVLDKCSSKDGLRVRQVLNVHCGLLSPPSGSREVLVTTFNCHIDLMIMGNSQVIMNILILCLDSDQPQHWGVFDKTCCMSGCTPMLPQKHQLPVICQPIINT